MELDAVKSLESNSLTNSVAVLVPNVTTTTTRVKLRKQPIPKILSAEKIISVQKFLDGYFQLENSDACSDSERHKFKFKCLQKNCQTSIVFYDTKRGLFNFKRHLKCAHGIIMAKTKKRSKVEPSIPITTETGAENCSSRPNPRHSGTASPAGMQLIRDVRVLVERLDTNPMKWPSKTTASKEQTSKTTVESCDLCIICGHTSDKNTMIEETRDQSRQDRNHSTSICRLLKIPQTQFSNFFQESKYCSKCWKNVITISEVFTTLDRMEKEILMWRRRVEKLLRTNVENSTSLGLNSTDEECNDYDLEEIILILMDEVGKSVTPVQSRRVHFSSDSEEIADIIPNEEVEIEYIDDHCYSVRTWEETGNQTYQLTSIRDCESDVDSAITLESHVDAEEFNDPDYDRRDYRDHTSECGDPGENQTGESPTQMTETSEFRCPHEGCTRVFATEETRGRHVRVVHESGRRSTKQGRKRKRKVWKCDKCDAIGLEAVFPGHIDLQDHRSRDDLHTWFVDDIWTCEICSEKLTSPRQVKKHREGHEQSADKKSCATCSLQFPTEEEVLIHALIHQVDTPFMCALCHVVSNSSVELKRHTILHHPEAVGVNTRFKCDFPGCDKTFKQECHKISHGLKHRGECPFKCSECDLTWLSEAQLILHMSSHSIEKKFQCEICGTQLKYKSDFKRHMHRHEVLEGNAVFKHECSICKKRFESTFRLRRHEEIHSGLKNMCNICEKGFAAKQNLDQHYKTHFKDKYPPKPRPKRERKNHGTRK